MLRPDIEANGHPPLTDALLGLCSRLRRHAGAIAEAANGPRSAPSAAVDPQLVDLLLGIVSVAQTLEKHISKIPEPAPSTPGEKNDRTDRGLLR